ncbi:hypothetical protein SMC26_34040 [Actinomadura fulvescens]|uniref:Uncharacterized protein n=1 Tax=Actinomadura fulvescens TaxID=46160 RepID=A0ABP6BY06_9ACTN
MTRRDPGKARIAKIDRYLHKVTDLEPDLLEYRRLARGGSGTGAPRARRPPA